MRLVVLLAIAGCYESPASTCSDGRVCGGGLVCNDVAGCVLPAQLAACTDKLMGDACSYPDHPRGVCANGACVPAGCGNGVVEADEVCDDGNTMGGDGCSADCRSDESCGNGVIDGQVGEQCDDGHYLSHDGCSSRCQLEPAVWTKRLQHLTNIVAPTSIAFDPLRRVTVALTQTDQGRNLTLVWDGTSWTSPATSTALIARDGASLAYDAALDEIVAFGGVHDNNGLADTIAWNGKDWHSIATAGAPSPGARAASAWDGAHQRIVLVTQDRKTWTFDGHAWTDAAATAPPFELSAPLACDPKRAVCVWYAHDGSTWEWDGMAWTQRAVTSPSPRDAAAMIYDTHRNVIALIGGRIAGAPIAETWEWNGVAWTSIAGGPSNDTVASFDPLTNTTLAISLTMTGYAMWQRTDTTWTAITEVPGLPFPIASSAIARAYDRDRGELVLGSLETWVWHGTSWSNIPGAQPTSQAATAGGRAGVIRFGGEDLTSAPMGTQQWTGAGWNELAVAQPPQRDGAVACDDVTGGVVLFGGVAPGVLYLADSWRWDGTTWTQLPNGPPATHVNAMAFDAHRGRTVLLGDTELQTWQWDGQAWSSLDVGPIVGDTPVLAYDANMQAIVVHSAYGTSTFDGTAWTALLGPASAPGCFALTYDAPRARTVCGTSSDIWTLALDSSGADEVCGSGLDVDGDGLIGCADPDCWPFCTPWCPPGAPCDPSAPRCGDGVCNAALENCRLCPGDCGACTAVCGDDICDPGEDHASCPGDCQ